MGMMRPKLRSVEVKLLCLIATIILGIFLHQRTSFWEISQLSNVSSVQRAFATSAQETQEQGVQKHHHEKLTSTSVMKSFKSCKIYTLLVVRKM